MDRLGRALSAEESKYPRNHIEYWRSQIAKHGPEHVKRVSESSDSVSEIWDYFAKDALDEYEIKEQKQVHARELKRISREEKMLDLARDAQPIAKQGNRETRNTWLVALFVGVAIIAVTIWVGLQPSAP